MPGAPCALVRSSRAPAGERLGELLEDGEREVQAVHRLFEMDRDQQSRDSVHRPSAAERCGPYDIGDRGLREGHQATLVSTAGRDEGTDRIGRQHPAPWGRHHRGAPVASDANNPRVKGPELRPSFSTVGTVDLLTPGSRSRGAVHLGERRYLSIQAASPVFTPPPAPTRHGVRPLAARSLVRGVASPFRVSSVGDGRYAGVGGYRPSPANPDSFLRPAAKSVGANGARLTLGPVAVRAGRPAERRQSRSHQ